MKKILTTIAAALAALGFAAGTASDDGHALTSLWKKYESAQSSDLPKKQLEILAEIKSQALKQRVPWDYYDACQKAKSVTVSMNWKLRDSASLVLEQEIKDYNDPCLNFFHLQYQGKNASEMLAFTEANAKALKKSQTPSLHAEASLRATDNLTDLVKGFFTNDNLNALWSTYFRGNLEKASKMLHAESDGTYPQGALLEYCDIAKFKNSDRELYKEFAQKYDGKAVVLLARQKELQFEFKDLGKDPASTPEDYKALRQKCETFLKDQKSFSGDEKQIAECCTGVAGLVETLDGQELSASVSNSVLTAKVRNISKLSVSLQQDGKEKFSAVLKNKEQSYYCLDTLTLAVPETLDDGEYELVLDYGETVEQTYERYSLSLATQKIGGKTCIYVADRVSGEPLSKVDVEVLDKKSERLLLHEGVDMSSFTELPSDVRAALDGKGKYLRAISKDANGRTRLSRTVSASGDSSSGTKQAERQSISLLTDCGAYNPGETLKFKAVVYSGDADDGYATAKAGKKGEFSLYDAENKQLATQSLTTNDFGSVAGEFVLPADCRGGSWRLSASSDKASVSKYVVVDEYILPNFELSFDELGGLQFPGDPVEVSGVVKAYSGHSLEGASLRWTCGEESGEQELASGGRFSFTVRPGSYDKKRLWTRVNVTVTDATGETRSYSRSILLSSDFLSVSLEETLEGDYTASEDGDDLGIISGDAQLLFTVRNTEDQDVDLPVEYRLFKDGILEASALVRSNVPVRVDLSKWASGLFTLKALCKTQDQAGTERTDECEATFLKVSEGAGAMDAPVSSFYRKVDSDGICLQMGDALKPLWAVVQLWGLDGCLLRTEQVFLNGERSSAGSLKSLDWEYKSAYPDEVLLSVFYFRDGKKYQKSISYERPVSEYVLPLSFSRFTDDTRPGQNYELAFKTAADAECAVTVFDKSSETIRQNVWSAVSLSVKKPSMPYINAVPGVDSSHRIVLYSGNRMSIAESGDAVLTKAAGSEEVSLDAAYGTAESSEAELQVRSDFQTSLAFEPFLRPDSEGNVSMEFSTSDKLSTYIVQIFAHDKQMKNSALRKEMLVTMPVRLSVVEPSYLFEGDKYRLKASISSTAKSEVSGKLTMNVYRGGEWEEVKAQKPLKTLSLDPGVLPAEGNLSCGFDLDVDEILQSAASARLESIGVQLRFAAGEYSDAIYFNIPVYEAAQTLTEAHSAVLLAGDDRAQTLAGLRALFVNTDAEGAEEREISFLDMVREALPELQNPESEDLLSLLNAWYANALSASLGGAGQVEAAQASLMQKILEMRNSDGGFAWFKDMTSSPVMTAILLQRLAALRDRGLLDPASSAATTYAEICSAACAYIDKIQFDEKGKRPGWCGGLTDEQYLLTRAMWADVDLAAKPDRKTRKAYAAYLTPKKNRGLQGEIFSKARRLFTLVTLNSSEEGRSLASSLGVKLRTGKKLDKSIKADYASLFEYAQNHKGGGRYFPNAVMPFRGLLESEASAHALICELFALPAKSVDEETAAEYAALADDLRIWMMLQKETQEWGSDPGFVEALSAILDGSQAVLDTKVLALSKTYRKPFDEIRAAGNGFSVSRTYALLSDDGSTTELKDSDTLHVGDKVLASYAISNEENRSFVRLNAPRPACLRPVDQVSGRYGWWLRPISVDNWYTFSPQGYRWVRADHSEYWFDSYTEGETVITETFYVTQEGVFTSPVTEVESLYAPHYRANDAFRDPMITR